MTVAPSLRETPCFARFAAALPSSHSNRTQVGYHERAGGSRVVWHRSTIWRPGTCPRAAARREPRRHWSQAFHVGLVRLNGIGGRFAAPLLPHHRAYGSRARRFGGAGSPPAETAGHLAARLPPSAPASPRSSPPTSGNGRSASAHAGPRSVASPAPSKRHAPRGVRRRLHWPEPAA